MSTQVKSAMDVVREYAIGCHVKAGKLYDNYLPYEFHLRMVVGVAYRFKHLVPEAMFETIIGALWNHDNIEDTGETYNDVKAVCGTAIANIAFALSNHKGKTRKERANDKYYEDIRNEPFADFCKYCDRIGNIEYGVMTAWAGGRMLDMYRKENKHFCEQLPNPAYEEMRIHIKNLLETK